MGTGALEDTGSGSLYVAAVRDITRALPVSTRTPRRDGERAWGLRLPLGKFHGGNQPL